MTNYLHNRDILFFFEEHANNENIKKALIELDKSCCDIVFGDTTLKGSGNWLQDMKEDSGSDSCVFYTMTELKKVKSGDLLVEHTGNGNISLVESPKAIKRKMKRLCKKKTLYRLKGDKDNAYWTINTPYNGKVKSLLEKKYGDKLVEVLNDTV